MRRELLHWALAIACMGAGATSSSAQVIDPSTGLELDPSRLGDLSDARADVSLLKSGMGPLSHEEPVMLVDPSTYMVGPGDVFQLNLSGRMSRSTLLTMGPEGKLFIPGFGPVNLHGVTLEKAREEVVQHLSARFTGVRVDFQLAQVRMMQIYVTGDVKDPGLVGVRGSSRASDAIPRNALLERGSRRNVEIRRRNGVRLIADLELFERTGRAELNPFLLDGDVIHVPTAVEFVEVNGAVARPGRYELGPADSMRTLIDLAGGPLPAALVEGALLVRWTGPAVSDSIFFNLEDLFADRVNLPLRDGDRMYIYFWSQFHQLEQATVMGEVVKPGTYPLETGKTRLSDLIQASGGFTERADLATIRVFRELRGARGADPEFDRLTRLSRTEMTDSEYEVLRTRLTERRTDFRVDWNRLRNSPNLDVLMRDGDVVRVEPLIASVRVEGEVRRPGIVTYVPGRSVDEYVGIAGGYSRLAAKSKVLITRTVTGQTLRARDVQSVVPGDLIWVPERKDLDKWALFRDILGIAGQIAVITVALTR